VVDADAADVVAEAAEAADAESADAEAAESADADAESADADGAAAAAAAERGVCLGVGADPGAKRKQPSLKSAIVGAGENRSDPALSLLCAANAARYGALDRATVTKTVSWSGRRRISSARIR
jgi:hypothetical protein